MNVKLMLKIKLFKENFMKFIEDKKIKPCKAVCKRRKAWWGVELSTIIARSNLEQGIELMLASDNANTSVSPRLLMS